MVPDPTDLVDPASTAHVDEAGAQLARGQRLYVVATVLTALTEHQKIIDVLTALQVSPDLPLHFRTERPERRVLIAHAIATAPLNGAILVHTSRTRDRLRQSHRITAALRVDHGGKAMPMLWTADFVASTYVAAHHHGEYEPWNILNRAHAIDVTTLNPG